MTESIWFTDSLMRVHIAPEDTDGAYALVEALMPPGHMPPPHIHEHDAEGFFVLEGEITLCTEDATTVLRPGQGAHAPAGRPHTFRVTSAGPTRAMLVSAPAGFVHYLRACGRPAERNALPVPADLVMED
jgi:quercetin dioxygenase-like cupin family protein